MNPFVDGLATFVFPPTIVGGVVEKGLGPTRRSIGTLILSPKTRNRSPSSPPGEEIFPEKLVQFLPSLEWIDIVTGNPEISAIVHRGDILFTLPARREITSSKNFRPREGTVASPALGAVPFRAQLLMIPRRGLRLRAAGL